jgi:hypothetical protein
MLAKHNDSEDHSTNPWLVLKAPMSGWFQSAE